MLDVAQTLTGWTTSASAELRTLVGRFTGKDPAVKRYLFGRNEQSRILASRYDIQAFVDDFAAPGSTWMDKPVVKLADVPADAILVNCVLNARPLTAAKRMAEAQTHHQLAYADLYRVDSQAAPLPDFVAQSREDLTTHAADWLRLEQRLADAPSRQVLADIMTFRFCGDYRCMSQYAFRPWDQYFEDFLPQDPQEVFVDAGGFEGETTEEFCKRYPQYHKVFLFEPSPNNLAKANQRLAGLRDIQFLPLGLSNTPGSLSFDASSGSASAVSASGTDTIEVTTLDQITQDRVTFIKMDLEGWELNALQGARQHLLDDHPKLAIGVYHHPADFRRVFDYVLGLRDDYDVYLRHYTESWTETVMYFVPR